MDFLFILIELFQLAVTDEPLRANIDWKSGVFVGDELVSAKFSRRMGRPPPTIFARLDRPMNTLQLCR